MCHTLHASTKKLTIHYSVTPHQHPQDVGLRLVPHVPAFGLPEAFRLRPGRHVRHGHGNHLEAAHSARTSAVSKDFDRYLLRPQIRRCRWTWTNMIPTLWALDDERTYIRLGAQCIHACSGLRTHFGIPQEPIRSPACLVGHSAHEKHTMPEILSSLASYRPQDETWIK